MGHGVFFMGQGSRAGEDEWAMVFFPWGRAVGLEKVQCLCFDAGSIPGTAELWGRAVLFDRTKAWPLRRDGPHPVLNVSLYST